MLRILFKNIHKLKTAVNYNSSLKAYQHVKVSYVVSFWPELKKIVNYYNDGRPIAKVMIMIIIKRLSCVIYLVSYPKVHKVYL